MSAVKYNVKAVIFDMDGVLTDTREPLLEAWKTTLDKYEIPIEIETLKSLVLGVVDYNKIKETLAGEHSFKGNIETLIREAEYYYRTISPFKIKPLAGLLDFIQTLKDKSIEMIVATSAVRETMDTVLSALGISPYFKYCFCSNDVVNRKPHPEVFQLAADSINVKNSECLVFEDTPCGIKASKGLNMMCFALATTYQPELLKDSDYIMHSFEDFPWELVSFKPKLISRNT